MRADMVGSSDPRDPFLRALHLCPWEATQCGARQVRLAALEGPGRCGELHWAGPHAVRAGARCLSLGKLGAAALDGTALGGSRVGRCALAQGALRTSTPPGKPLVRRESRWLGS